MLYILLTLVVIGVLYWAAKRILAVLPIEDPMKTIIVVVLTVIVVFWVIQLFFGAVPGWPVVRWR